MNKPIILHLISSLTLVGGTPAKIRVLIANSQYQHIVCYHKTDTNDLYIHEWEKLENCTLVEGITRKNYLKDACFVNKLLRRYHANIIHVYFPPDTVTASLVKRVNPDVKLIRSFEGNIQQGIIKRTITKICLTNFDKIIYISNYVKEFYENKIPSSLVCKSVIIFNSAARQSRLESPIYHKAAAKRIVSVSGLNPSKNLFILIEAMRVLKERDKNIHLDILGDGLLKAELQNKIDRYHLQDQVTLHGFSTDVLKYLDASSIYVHPANNEGFGMAVVEAMQRYCAVIVSDAGALPEIITDKVDGLIANANDYQEWVDKIESLLNNQNLTDKLGEAAYKKATTSMSVEAYARNHDKLYTENYQH